MQRKLLSTQQDRKRVAVVEKEVVLPFLGVHLCQPLQCTAPFTPQVFPEWGTDTSVGCEMTDFVVVLFFFKF
jgi:hypothetical protein